MPSIFHSKNRTAKVNFFIEKYGRDPAYIKNLMGHVRRNGLMIVGACFSFILLWSTMGQRAGYKNKYGGGEIEHYEHQLHFKHHMKHANEHGAHHGHTQEHH